MDVDRPNEDGFDPKDGLFTLAKRRKNFWHDTEALFADFVEKPTPGSI